ncbi:phage major capsid protein, partial [Oenococcus oeni]
MNVNEINDAWVASGQKVSDLNAKINTAVLDDENYDEAAVKDLKGQRDKEVSRRNDLKDALEQARKDAKVIKPKQEVKDVVSDVKPKKDIVEIKKDFVNNFRGLIRNDPRVLNMLTSSTDDPATVAGALGSGLVIPQDIETAINTLVRQYASLQQYVKVESVGTQTGSRVYEKWTDVTPLADLDDETATIGDNDDPRLTKVSYA